MLHGSIRHDYTGRRRKKKTTKGEVYQKYKPQPFVEMTATTQPYRRGEDGPTYKSVDSGCGVAPKIESMKYTGTLVKGIATMHKSNAVPIIDEQQAKEVSQMRRN